MSIQTELARLTNAKAAIQAAIEGKGVTVPSGTLLDGMAALIDAIEAGGGSPSGFKLCAGSITLAENSASIDISSLLGFSPSTAKHWTITFFAVNDSSPTNRFDVLFCNVTYYGYRGSPINTNNLRYRNTVGSHTNFYSLVGQPTYSDGIITISESYGYWFKSGLPLYYVYLGEE